MDSWTRYKTRKLINDGILEIGDGYRAKKSEMGSPGLPFVRAGDVDGRVNTDGGELLGSPAVSRAGNKLSRPGDVVLTTKGTIGRIAFVDEKTGRFVYSPQLCYWRSLKPDVLVPKFLFYCLQSDDLRHQMSWSAAQTDMAPYISLTDQRDAFELTVPDPGLQSRIAEVLGSLDDKIDLNRRMNETLEAMAQAIFRDWFVDFGPTRRKLEGATDPVTIMGGLVIDPVRAQELADLFPAALGDEGLPEGWSTQRIDEVLCLEYGKALTKTERRDGPYPVYGSGGIGGWHETPLVSGPSIIVGRKGTIGSLYWEDRDFYPIDTVFYVQSRQPLTYCFYLLQTLGLHGMNTDAAVPGLNRNNVYRLLVPQPPTPMIESFDELAQLLRRKFTTNERECETLASTRELLLAKLMSGEVRVCEAGASRRVVG